MRADEEILMIRKEMEATVSFYLLDWQQLFETINKYNMTPYTLFNNGALAYLQIARLKCEGMLRNLTSSFSQFIDLNYNELPFGSFLTVPVDIHSKSQPSTESDEDSMLL